MSRRLKRATTLKRVDKEIWEKAEGLMPGESSATISRMLYNTSLLRAEDYLRRKDTSIDQRIFGKNDKKKTKRFI